MLQLPFHGSTFAFWGGPQHCGIVHHKCKYLTQIRHLFGRTKNLSWALGFYTKMALPKNSGKSRAVESTDETKICGSGDRCWPQDQPNTGQNIITTSQLSKPSSLAEDGLQRNRAGDIRHHLAHLQRWIEQETEKKNKKQHDNLTNDMENPHVFW